MSLATRTGLAAMAAAMLSMTALVGAVSFQFQHALRERVDDQLVERSANAAIIAAIGERVSISELSATVEAARISDENRITEIGALPEAPLPEIEGPGWRTAIADGEEWRLYAVQVTDVPQPGDSVIVELAAPLGDVNDQVRRVRRTTLITGFLAAIAAGVAGWLLGRRAVRPLTLLRQDAESVGNGNPSSWSIRTSYDNREVDEVANALNTSLERLGEETVRRHDALVAARAFAASAAHELRTPMQSAMTNLDVALASSGEPTRPNVERARVELQRMGSALTSVGSLARADLIENSQFDLVDLADLADEAIARHVASNVEITYQGDEHAPARLWADGVGLALDNLIRNAITHGRPPSGAPVRVIVAVSAQPVQVTVSDNGPGIAPDDYERIVRPFERGATDTAGSGLGLAFVQRIAGVHGGELTIERSALGGTRFILKLSPPIE